MLFWVEETLRYHQVMHLKLMCPFAPRFHLLFHSSWIVTDGTWWRRFGKVGWWWHSKCCFCSRTVLVSTSSTKLRKGTRVSMLRYEKKSYQGTVVDIGWETSESESDDYPAVTIIVHLQRSENSRRFDYNIFAFFKMTWISKSPFSDFICSTGKWNLHFVIKARENFKCISHSWTW